MKNIEVLFTVSGLLVIACVFECASKESSDNTISSGKAKKKKSILDYNDADMERIFDEWEKDEEPLAPDELPEHLRPSPQIDLSKLNANDPEGILKMTKKGKTLMMFVTVSDNPAKSELESITSLWHTSLFNMHIESQRFLVDDRRAIFMFSDGAKAWEAKDFLVDQDRCEEVVIESKSYPGKHSKKPIDANAKEEL